MSLDDWQPAWVKVMAKTGNSRANVFWEASLSSASNTSTGSTGRVAKPNPQTATGDLEAFIEAKYLDRAFVTQEGGTEGGMGGDRTLGKSSGAEGSPKGGGGGGAGGSVVAVVALVAVVAVVVEVVEVVVVLGRRTIMAAGDSTGGRAPAC